MANQEQLALLNQGVEAWNSWREQNPETEIDLTGSNFRAAQLSHVNFRGADLRNTSFIAANLHKADLFEARLIKANLQEANLSSANCRKADLQSVNLARADLTKANFSEANLLTTDFSSANLIEVNFRHALLTYAIFNDARLVDVNLCAADLRQATFVGAILSSVDVESANFGMGLGLSEADKELLIEQGGNFDISQDWSQDATGGESLIPPDHVSAGPIVDAAEPSIHPVTPSENVENFEISILHPRRLAKGFSTGFIVHINLQSARTAFESRLSRVSEQEQARLEAQQGKPGLEPGMQVAVSLSSSAIRFSPEKMIQLRNNLNVVSFNALPELEFSQGWQVGLVSIRASETQFEYESVPFACRIDDYAFGHISKPLVSYVTSSIMVLIAIVLGSLTYIGKIDKAMGVAAGVGITAGAAFVGVRTTWLYQQKTKNTQ